jgi:hypothetical protein
MFEKRALKTEFGLERVEIIGSRKGIGKTEELMQREASKYKLFYA